MCVDFIVDRLIDASELYDGVASFERFQSLFKVGQVRGDEGESRVVAELGVCFRDLVDSDDGMTCPEGSQDDGLAYEAVTPSHGNLHHL